jgi:putative zinc finger/helix-turn-helix YgiT family protein
VRLVHVDRHVQVKHEGTLHEITIPDFPVEKCGVCGEITIGSETDTIVAAALRKHLDLLQPDRIRAARKRLGMTQQELAERLGCASETLSRWESGVLVQSRAYDRMLRVYFKVPAARRYLESTLNTAGGDESFEVILDGHVTDSLSALTDPPEAFISGNGIGERIQDSNQSRSRWKKIPSDGRADWTALRGFMKDLRPRLRLVGGSRDVA